MHFRLEQQMHHKIEKTIQPGMVYVTNRTWVRVLAKAKNLEVPLSCSTFAGIALHHLAVGLEALLGDHVHGQLLVVGLLRRHQRRVRCQRVVDPIAGGGGVMQLGLSYTFYLWWRVYFCTFHLWQVWTTSILKRQCHEKGIFFWRSKHLISTFCVIADGFHCLSKAFYYPWKGVTGRIFKISK